MIVLLHFGSVALVIQIIYSGYKNETTKKLTDFKRQVADLRVFFSHHIRLTPARVFGVMASRACPIPPSSMRAPCPLCHARPCPVPSDEELVSTRSRRRARLALIRDYPP